MIVTFDTNAYRKLIEDVRWAKITPLVDKLVELESQKGYTSMIGNIAASELLSHLVDDVNSIDYHSCLKACTAMYKHCGNDMSYRMLPAPQTQIALEYFGAINNKAIQDQKTLASLLYLISKAPGQDTIKSEFASFQSVKNHIVNSEKCLIDEVQNLCKTIDSNYSDWKLFVCDNKKRKEYLKFIRSTRFKDQTARAMLCAVYMQLVQQGIQVPQLSTSGIANMSDTFQKSYATALSLRQFFFEQIGNAQGFNLSTKSRANYMWDEQILYFVGHQVNGENIVLVTSDSNMLKAAKNVGLSDSVISLEKYLDDIGLKRSDYICKLDIVVKKVKKLYRKIIKKPILKLLRKTVDPIL